MYKQINHLKYRPDIDGLRAFAVLAVVIFHAFPGHVKGGFIGVDIFFVISGFLISTIIFKNTVNGGFDFFDFYSRRIKRIFPSLLFVLISCAIFGWFFLLSDEYEQLGKHMFAGSVFISNLVLWNESGYFDSIAETKPLLHLWSLGVEEQFYIFWPIIVLVAWKAKVNLYYVVIGLLVASLSLCIWQTGIDSTAAFYSPQTRFWELLIGSLLAFSLLNINLTISTSTRNSISFVGIILLILSILLISSTDYFPGWVALIPAIGAVFIIVSGKDAWVNKFIFSNKITVWFGVISYPLYLWHWPILSFLRIIEGGKPSIWVRVLGLSLSVLLAWLTFLLIEKPIRFRSSRFNVVIPLTLIMTAVSIFGLISFLYKGFPERDALKNVTSNKQAIEQMVGSRWGFTNNNTCLNRYPFEKADENWNFCIKNSTNEPTVILLGNSYANQLYPGFVNNANLNHHSILSIGDFDPSGYDNYDLSLTSKVSHERLLIDRILASTPKLEYVVMSGISDKYNSDYINNLKRRIDIIESSGAVVVLFTPHIKPPFHPKYCYSRPNITTVKDCSFPIATKDVQLLNFSSLMKSILESNPKVRIFDQNQLFCQGLYCSYLKNGLPLYRDESHISEYASTELAILFAAWAKINMPEILSSK